MYIKYEQQSDSNELIHFTNHFMQNINQTLSQAFNLVSRGHNDLIKRGQAILGELKKRIPYPIMLLNYMSNATEDQRLKAAIQLRIWCEAYKNMEEYERRNYLQIIDQVKTQIVIAYLNYDLKISKTLRPGIVCLADIQFPDNWQNIVPGLINYARSNSNGMAGVLKLIQSISQKYNYSTRSDPLYNEINIMCDNVHDFLLQLASVVVPLAMNRSTEHLVVLRLIMKVFYNLNYQDLHPKFQDNIQKWMLLLNQTMKLQNLNEDTFKCKGAALESILLYASKYKQDVQASTIKDFSENIWNLCSNATQDSEYDTIVLNSLKYFRSLISWPQMKDFFTNNLENLISNLILPNLTPNKSTVQLFENQPQSFIDYYFRSAQVGTRRASAIQLLKTICRYFPSYQNFLNSQILSFVSSNPDPASKLVMITLLIQSISKGFRDLDGTTQLFFSSEIIQYCYQNVIKSSFNQIYQWLNQNNNSNIQSKFDPLYVSTLLRFVFYFRIYIPVNQLSSIISLLSLIVTQKESLKNIVFMLMNAILTVRHGDFVKYVNIVPYYNAQNLKDNAIDIFKSIFINDQKEEKLNQMLTKMLFSLSKILGNKCTQYYDYFVAIFQQMLLKTQKYDFKSVIFLFETMGHVSFYLLSNKSSNAKLLEDIIFSYFQIALKKQSDLLNFCFQLISIYLGFNQTKINRYFTIYQSILNPTNWSQDNISIMSSYILFISTFIRVDNSKIIQDKEAFSIILSKLIQIQHYSLFYRLLSAILLVTDLDGFYNSGYLNIAVQGSQIIGQKSVHQLKITMMFFFKLTFNYDINKAINYINNVQQGYFLHLINIGKDIIQTMQLRVDRRLMFGALCKAITSNAFNNNEEAEGTILNLLIQNITSRFSRNIMGIAQTLKETQLREKKQASFQKLSIFKQIDIKEQDVDLEEETALLQTYQILYHNHPSAFNYITNQNQQRIKRINDKNKKY